MLKRVEAENPDSAMEEPLAPKRRRRPSLAVGLLRSALQIVLMGAVLAGSYVMMNRLIAAKPERTARPQFEVILPVQATTVTVADQRPTVRLFGEITASRTIDIRSSVSGEAVSVNPNLGAGLRVEADDVLFEIDPFDFEVALAEAKATLAQTDAAIAENNARLAAEREQLAFAQSQLDLARADLERAQQLRRNGTLNQKGVEDRLLLVSQREQTVSQRQTNISVEEAKLAQQSATRERLALGVEKAQRNLTNTVVRAPFAGVVRSSTVEQGRIVSANDVAVSLYDDTALDVRFTLTDDQYGRIAVDGDPLIGRDVKIVWTVGATDYEYTGKVTRIGAEIASARGGVDVYARLAENDAPVQLRPGAFVSVSVPDRLYPSAVRLPETALFDTGTVYVIADGQLQARDVIVSAYDGSDAIITSGLAGGEQVLSTRISDIEDGLKVRVVDDSGTAIGSDGQPAAEPMAQDGGGRPSPEMIEAAKKISGLTDAQWDALSREERRPYFDKAREAAGAGN